MTWMHTVKRKNCDRKYDTGGENYKSGKKERQTLLYNVFSVICFVVV